MYDLCLTTDRVIAVLMRQPGNVTASASLSTLFIGSWGSKRKEERKQDEKTAGQYRKSQSLSPDELLALNPNNNFQISNNDIDSIEIKRDIFLSYHITFQVSVSGRKVSRSFTIKKDQVQEAKQLLTRIFSAKFKAL